MTRLTYGNHGFIIDGNVYFELSEMAIKARSICEMEVKSRVQDPGTLYEGAKAMTT